MGLAQTAIFYLVIGTGVSVALLVSGGPLTAGERLFRTVTGLFFWPLYLPVLLQRRADDDEDMRPPSETDHGPPADVMAAAIAQVEAELDRALGSLDGWAENVLADEQARLHELRAAWRVQAARIRELDQLLARPEFLSARPVTADDAGTDDRLRLSEQMRQENIARLRAIRRRLHDDLMGTLAWVRELVTMIHLAKFTGAPASRAEELVAQIAAAVEGLSEATAWQEEPLTGAAS